MKTDNHRNNDDATTKRITAMTTISMKKPIRIYFRLLSRLDTRWQQRWRGKSLWRNPRLRWEFAQSALCLKPALFQLKFLILPFFPLVLTECVLHLPFNPFIMIHDTQWTSHVQNLIHKLNIDYIDKLSLILLFSSWLKQRAWVQSSWRWLKDLRPLRRHHPHLLCRFCLFSLLFLCPLLSLQLFLLLLSQFSPAGFIVIGCNGSFVIFNECRGLEFLNDRCFFVCPEEILLFFWDQTEQQQCNQELICRRLHLSSDGFKFFTDGFKLDTNSIKLFSNGV